MWARVLADVVRVTSEWDRAWMQRRRLLNTLLVVLFVFRLVLAPRNQGYAATATELWDQCRQLDIPLPQSAPVSPGEVAVYDRGYYSFGLLHTHCARGVQAVFRLKKNANGPLRAFIRSALSADQIVVEPSATARAQLPDTLLRPCRVRLVKYTAGASSFALATTLLDARAYPARALAALYHGRWSIEELYKISKQMLTVEYFHSRSERGVKQELFAHFTLIAMTRLFTNHTEGCYCSTRPRCARPSGACSPAPASRPLLSAEIAQARQQMEVLQQVRQDQASHTCSLTPHNPARNDGISA